MGKYFFATYVIAVWLLHDTVHQVALWIAIALGVVNLWSLGILHNYKHDVVVSRYMSIVSAVNMATSILGIFVLIYAWVVRA